MQAAGDITHRCGRAGVL